MPNSKTTLTSSITPESNPLSNDQLDAALVPHEGPPPTAAIIESLPLTGLASARSIRNDAPGIGRPRRPARGRGHEHGRGVPNRADRRFNSRHRG
ncbi:hypothetical protein [Paraliomyxa miuraensis]|uniref:hypothetical protein n=1 Tax=Paraliomyxa miuraensis TaxID=376150 RepID=UPI002255CE71|nr:hypothetical protein [Paraliomyxa miuraensis]MCX4246002.1 hypothetical protein [Paraliomyxa miuraensis]